MSSISGCQSALRFWVDSVEMMPKLMSCAQEAVRVRPSVTAARVCLIMGRSLRWIGEGGGESGTQAAWASGVGQATTLGAGAGEAVGAGVSCSDALPLRISSACMP
jgi:hypothetical protein